MSFIVLWSESDLNERLESSAKFRILFKDVEEIYENALKFGFSLEPDSYGGFCLMNRSKQTFPQGLDLQHTVGLLQKIGTGSTVDDISVMTGERLLIGIARWANHSCDPNCEYYM